MTALQGVPDGAGAGTAAMAFLAGGGEMGRRIAELDGAGTPLGPVDGWSTTLRTAVGICVTSRHPMVIWWGPELVLIYNDAWLPILGPTKHPALGLPGARVWPETWHIIGAQLEGVLSTGEATWSIDQLLPVHRFGYLEEAYFTYSYSPIRADDGHVAGVFTAVTETTSRVLGERRLRTLRELGEVAQATDVEQACARTLAALSTNRADIPFAAVYLRSPDHASARLVATEGLRRTVLPETLPPPGRVGHSVWTAVTECRAVASSGLAVRLPGLTHPGHNPVGDADADTAVAIPLTDAGQERPFGVLVLGTSPYRALDADYRSFLDLVADQVSTALTDVQAHETARARTTALAELDRAKTEFFTGVSHELRTPLTLIVGPAQDALADTDEPLPPGQRDRMELIRRNSGRLRRLVDTLLDFARLEAGRLTPDRAPVDLAHLTRAIAGTFAPAAERAGLAFGIDCPDPASTVLVDPDMWERIVLNLLSNAVKYTLDGRVDLRLRSSADGATELVVSDTGVGIPAADLARVFDRFHRVRGAQARSAEGTGIGLALVSELVGLHGGEVRATSTPGAGSTFTVRLPASARTDRPSTGPRASSSVGLFLNEALSWGAVAATGGPAGDGDVGAVPGRIDTGSTAGATVLVAEDNPDLRRFVAGLLRPHYEVHEAADGRAALEIARQRSVDLVLSDVMMPGLDGVGLLAALRAHPSTAGVPVVLLSARAGEEAAIEGLHAGADDYLTKPFSSHDLVARVRSNLELARLRSHETRWRTAMIDSLQDGFYVVDIASAAIIEINPAMTVLLGLRPEDLPCRPPYPIFPSAAEDADELAMLSEVYATAVTQDRGEVVVPLRHAVTRERVWVSVSYSALPARDGQGPCHVGTMRDVTAQRRAAERDSLLAEAGAVLVEPTDLVDRLDRFSRVLSTGLADLVVVSLRGPDGRLTPVAAAHRHLPGLADQQRERGPIRPSAAFVERCRAGRAFVPAERTAGPARTLVVPLVVGGRLLGTVDLVGTAAGEHGPDVVLAEEIGRRIAGAVDAERLLRREAQLQTVTAALAAAGTLSEAAAALVAGVRDALAAESVAVYSRDPDGQLLRLVRSTGRGPGDRPETIRLDGTSAPARAARTAGPVWPTATEAGWDGGGTTAAVPLVTGDLVVGVLVADFHDPREFPADEREFAAALTGQAAQSFERAALADQRWQLAQALQHALLPGALPDLDGLGLAARYLPAMREFQAGGDWYDVFALDDGRVALVVGDVVGQGPSAAAVMGQLRSVLATYLHDGLGPAAALEGLDRATARIPGARGSTALCLILDTATGEVRWSAAGHLPPLLSGPDGSRFGVGGEGTLLGLAGRPPYVEGRDRIRAGDTIGLYTDGLVERRGEVVDDGLERLAAAAADLHRHAADVLIDALLERILGTTDTGDDVALVLARLLPDPVHRRLVADPAQLPALRRAATRWGAEAGLSEDTAADVVLVLSEAVTNCVEHAYRDRPGELMWGLARVRGGGVRIRVQDFGSWRPPPADPGYRGRGLAVIHTLAEHVELDATDSGTTITIDIPASTEPLAARPVVRPSPQWWSRPPDHPRRG